MRLSFQLRGQDARSRARRGLLETPRGRVETPAFMPVGTRASVTGLTPAEVAHLGAEIILGNTYHLLLRPGAEVVEAIGGSTGSWRWPGPVLTDSGGFQIFSLADDRTITEEGARFRSYVDCRKQLLSPERSIEVQTALGSDVMMVLDVCLPSTAEPGAIREAMERTHRWALRSLAARGDRERALFAIVQGGLVPALRAESARFLTAHPFDGFAIGGLAVGDTRAERFDVVARTAELLPRTAPATSWASGRHRISSRRSPTAWTSSTACSRRRWPGRAPPSRRRGASASREAITGPPPRPSTRAAPARRARRTRAPTSTTS